MSNTIQVLDPAYSRSDRTRPVQLTIADATRMYKAGEGDGLRQAMKQLIATGQAVEIGDDINPFQH